MHGHKRAEYKARMSDPKVAAGLQHKANQWFKLNDKVLAMPTSLSDATTTATTMTNLELLSNMLQVNPDPLYLWQRRRTLLQFLFQNENEKDHSDKSNTTTTFDQYISEELSLTRKCLERNPKAYGAWFHRKWSVMESIQRKVSSSSTASASSESSALSLLQHELQLTEQFLNLDERNFHCWSYRRFVVGCMCGNTSGEIILMDGSVLFGPQVGNACTKQEQDQIGISKTTDVSQAAVTSTPVVTLTAPQIQSILNSEFDFTTHKIRQNFSNGSAFHYRSKLLPHVHSSTAVHSVVSLADELELAHNAMFTEPDDQTAWWYYDFLLTEYGSPCGSSASMTIGRNTDQDDGHERTERIDLEQEKELLEELLEAEGGQSKWALLALYHVLSYMEGDDNNEQRESRRCEILEALQELDPDRRVRYQDMMRKKTKKP
jgi:geranylgeranyl transferase type-2 subunit alpha